MLLHWDPFHTGLVARRLSTTDTVHRPAVDIREESDAFVVSAELPGVKAEEVDVSVENGRLSIRGERKLARDDDEKKTFRRIERFHGAFERSFSLPDTVDGTDVSATLRDGILVVRVPKKAEPQPRKIAIAS